ncbi:Fc.00g069730.m01.CDS01 [Cosmosporella sp. VM-42]
MLVPRLGRLGGFVPRSSRVLVQFRALSVSTSNRADLPRSTLSNTWVPTGGIAANEEEFGHGKLIRAGFLRQAHSGIFQMLPLGLRVQDKIEKLIDKHMRSVGASRLSLSTVSSEDLWRKSGRLEAVSSELFRFHDRKEVPLILSPTHEEEITTLVASTLKSYKDLPIRLYQITRKYRDERRPRHGLLRGREFLMKDLYTFDLTSAAAIETYKEVSAAYRAFFTELKMPFLVAEASSGDMGGDLSHEYHLPSAVGEDTVVSCNSCGYAANDEVAAARSPSTTTFEATPSQFRVWRGVTKDGKTLVNAWYPQSQDPSSESSLNLHAVKSAVPELDTSIEDCSVFWMVLHQLKTAKVINVIDARLAPTFNELQKELPLVPEHLVKLHDAEHSFIQEANGEALNLLSLADGDGCPRCEEGTLEVHKALEVGHTFHLGTRYSVPLDACVTLPQTNVPEVASEGLKAGSRIPVQMGCHGVGVSRIFGAVAELLADEKGLNWPRVIAPFEAAIISTSESSQEAAFDLYDTLTGRNNSGSGLDVVLDDRKQSFGWKMKDADLVGYPVVIVLGKTWRENGTCEVQCRRLSVKENVSMEDVPEFVSGLLDKL